MRSTFRLSSRLRPRTRGISTQWSANQRKNAALVGAFCASGASLLAYRSYTNFLSAEDEVEQIDTIEVIEENEQKQNPDQNDEPQSEETIQSEVVVEQTQTIEEPTSEEPKPTLEVKEAGSEQESTPKSSSEEFVGDREQEKKDNGTVDDLRSEIEQLKALLSELNSSNKAQALLEIRNSIEQRVNAELQQQLEKLENEYEDKIMLLSDQARQQSHQLRSNVRDALTQTSVENETKLEELRQEWQGKLNEKATSIRESIEQQLQLQLDQIYEEIQTKSVNEYESLKQTLDQQNESQKQTYKELLERMRKNQHNIQAHEEIISIDMLQKICLEYIDLTTNVEANKPYDQSLSYFRKTARKDPILSVVLSGIPQKSTSLPDLLDEFSQMKTQVRRAAFTPEGANPLWNLWGLFVSTLTFPVKGLVSGSDPDSVLSRAEYYLIQGDLEQSLDQLNILSNSSTSLLQDWKYRVQQRIVLERSLSFIRSHIVHQILSSTHRTNSQ